MNCSNIQQGGSVLKWLFGF